MYHTVHIKPNGYNLLVEPGETVLSAALRQGYRFPHDCQNAICGTCRGLLIEGQVEYTEPSAIGLTEDEREAGYALFCSAKPLTDLIIEVQGVYGPGYLPPKKLSYSLKELNQLTPTIYQAFLEAPQEDRIRYHAGQYLEILHRDGSPKPFSIANAPIDDAGLIELHIRYTQDNPYSIELVEELRATKQILLKGPFGSSILHKFPAYPLLLVAGGTGIVPFKALIEKALAEGFKHPIYLYWGVRSTADFYLQNLIERWQKYVPNFHYIPVLSNKGEIHSWSGKTGLVHDAVLQDHADISKFHVYASGPTEMVYATYHALLPKGLNRALFHSDVFDYQPL